MVITVICFIFIRLHLFFLFSACSYDKNPIHVFLFRLRLAEFSLVFRRLGAHRCRLAVADDSRIHGTYYPLFIEFIIKIMCVSLEILPIPGTFLRSSGG